MHSDGVLVPGGGYPGFAYHRWIAVGQSIDCDGPLVSVASRDGWPGLVGRGKP